MQVMTGLTLSEMALKLGIPKRTVERRVQRAGIKPLTHEALYPSETLDIIKERNRVGRPPETKAPTKKTKTDKPKK